MQTAFVTAVKDDADGKELKGYGNSAFNPTPPSKRTQKRQRVRAKCGPMTGSAPSKNAAEDSRAVALRGAASPRASG
jgi:hypothetical protein